MIPVNQIDTVQINETVFEDRTYRLYEDKIQGTIDGIEALQQAIVKILSTEKYEYPIYSFDYGVEWKKLLGKDVDYVKIEFKRLVKEALLNDDRIEDVKNFIFKNEGDELICKFDVVSIYGEFSLKKEVNF